MPGFSNIANVDKDPAFIQVNAPIAVAPQEESSGIWGRGWSMLTNVKDGVTGAVATAYSVVATEAMRPVTALGNFYAEGSRVCANLTTENLKAGAVRRLTTWLKGTIEGREAIEDPKIKKRLESLDENNKLPQFSAAISQFIVKKLEKFIVDKSGNLESYLTFIIHRSLAYLACYKEAPAAGERGQLFTNMIETLSAIIGETNSAELKKKTAEYTALYLQVKSFTTSEVKLEDKIRDLEARERQHKKKLDFLPQDSSEKATLEESLEAIQVQLTAYRSLHADNKLNLEYDEYAAGHYQKGMEDYYSDSGSVDAPLLQKEEWLESHYPTRFPPKSSAEERLVKERTHLIKLMLPTLKKLTQAAGIKSEAPVEYLLKFLGAETPEGQFENAVSYFVPTDRLLQLPGQLLDVYVESRAELKRPEKEVSDLLEAIEGMANFDKDAKGLAEKKLPEVFEMLGKEAMRVTIGHTIKDVLDEQGIGGLERAWVEKVLEKCADGNDTLVNAFKSFCAELVAPRLTKAAAHAGLADAKASGNLLQRIMTNGVNLVSNFFQDAEGLPEAVFEYDRTSALAEALTWRNRYLKEITGLLKAADCDSNASALTQKDVVNILKMGSYDFDKIYALLKSTSLYIDEDLSAHLHKDPALAASLLLDFFHNANTAVVNERLDACLAKSFAPLADQFLAVVGLSSDADLAIPGATGNRDTALYDFNALRKSLLPKQLLNLYRQMGDIKGERAKTREEAKALFGNSSEAFNDFAKLFTGLVTDPVKTYLKDHAAEIVDKIEGPEGFMPASKQDIAEAIQGVATDVLNLKSDVENKAPESTGVAVGAANVEAAKVISGYTDELVRGGIMKIMTAFAKRSKSRNGGKEMNAEQPSLLLADILSEVGELFAKHRPFINKKMGEYRETERSGKLLAKATADEATRKSLEEITAKVCAKLLQDAFTPVCEEIIKISGLKCSDLRLPDFCQDTVWDAMMNQLTTNLAAIYADMTHVEYAAQTEKLNEIGIEHGFGAVQAVSRFTIKLVQSMLAVDNKMITDSLYSSMVDFFKDSKGPEGERLAKALAAADGGQSMKALIEENLSSAAKNAGFKDVLSAVENYLQPVLQNTVVALGSNLKDIQDNNPDVLKKMARNAILVAGDHFKQIHAVALRENKKNAFDVDPLILLEGVTSDEHVLNYVLLKEKEGKIKASLKQKNSKGRTTLRAQAKEDLSDEIKKVEKELSVQKDEIKSYVAKHWSDGGIAVKCYLKTERCLRQAEKELKMAKRSFWQRKENIINAKNPKETDAVKVARSKIAGRRTLFDKAKQVLESANRQPIKTDAQAHEDKGVGKLVNLSCQKEYQILKADLKKATAENQKMAQQALDDYRVENYFQPLTKKLLKLADGDQFDAIPFPSMFPKEWKDTMVKLAKDKLLPSVLNNVFYTLTKPETLQGIMLTAMKKLNQEVENPVAAVQGNQKSLAEPDDEFDQVCGKMIMDLIEMNALGGENAIFASLIKRIDIEGSAGKTLGAALREYLASQSLPKLMDTALEAAAGNLVPEGEWNVKREFLMGVDKNPLPQTPEELQKQKNDAVVNKKKVEEEFKVEMAKLISNNTLAQAKGFIHSLSATLMTPWNKFREFVHATFDRLFEPETAAYLKKSFDQLSAKFLAVITALLDFVATIVIKPVMEGLLKFFYKHIGKIFVGSHVDDFQKMISMEIHERLLFQLTNICVGTLENEHTIAKNKKAILAAELVRGA